MKSRVDVTQVHDRGMLVSIEIYDLPITIPQGAGADSVSGVSKVIFESLQSHAQAMKAEAEKALEKVAEKEYVLATIKHIERDITDIRDAVKDTKSVSIRECLEGLLRAKLALLEEHQTKLNELGGGQ